MITITILYPNKEGGRFDADYYVNTHMPMSIARFGDALKGVNISLGLNAGLPGSQPPFVAVCQLLFESQEAFEKRFNEISPDLIADMPNYTDIDITFQISDAKIVRHFN
jgi:uncharacterized protein (TIGR02118 family)